MENQPALFEKTAKKSDVKKSFLRSGWIKRFFIALLIALLVAQFFQPDKNNNDVIAKNSINNILAPNDRVKALLTVACYDCHSNYTNYPWYSNIQPIGWWLKDHIDEGKKHFNFDEFATYPLKKQIKKLDEVSEMVHESEMPLNSYLWTHKEAKLNAAQKKMITDWAASVSAKIKVDSIN